MKIAEETASAMNWLHCMKPNALLHLDLKPANLLVHYHTITITKHNTTKFNIFFISYSGFNCVVVDSRMACQNCRFWSLSIEKQNQGYNWSQSRNWRNSSLHATRNVQIETRNQWKVWCLRFRSQYGNKNTQKFKNTSTELCFFNRLNLTNSLFCSCLIVESISVLWQLFTEKVPFEGKYSQTHQLVEAVTRGERPVIPDNCPKKLRYLQLYLQTSDFHFTYSSYSLNQSNSFTHSHFLEIWLNAVGIKILKNVPHFNKFLILKFVLPCLNIHFNTLFQNQFRHIIYCSFFWLDFWWYCVGICDSWKWSLYEHVERIWTCMSYWVSRNRRQKRKFFDFKTLFLYRIWLELGKERSSLARIRCCVLSIDSHKICPQRYPFPLSRWSSWS